jgi:hypothetical protein
MIRARVAGAACKSALAPPSGGNRRKKGRRSAALINGRSMGAGHYFPGRGTRDGEKENGGVREREATELRRAPAHVRRAPVATGTKVQPRVRARKVGGRGGGGRVEGADRRVYARAYTCVRMRVRPPGGREGGRTGEEPYLRGRGERLEVIHRRETRECNIACELRGPAFRWPVARGGVSAREKKHRGLEDASKRLICD